MSQDGFQQTSAARRSSHAAASTSGRTDTAASSQLPAVNLPALLPRTRTLPSASTGQIPKMQRAISLISNQQQQQMQQQQGQQQPQQWQQQQQQGQPSTFLPSLSGTQPSPAKPAAALHAPSGFVPSPTRTRIGAVPSLQPIPESPDRAFTATAASHRPPDIAILDDSVTAVDNVTPLNNATHPGGGMHAASDSQAGWRDAALSSDGSRGRVSRGGSSIRSEQSAGSQSPDKAAAKQQRYKVCCYFISNDVNDFFHGTCHNVAPD